MGNLAIEGNGWKATPMGDSSDCIWDFEGSIPCSVLVEMYQQGLILPILKFSTKLRPEDIETSGDGRKTIKANACREVVAEIQSDLWGQIVRSGLLPAMEED